MRLSLLIIFSTIIYCNRSSPSNSSTLASGPPPQPSLWQQVWNDEFNYTGLPDSTKWNYDVGGNGWGNNELEFYTQKRVENARVENGNLVIETRKESWQGMNYTSARLLTKN